MCDLRRVKYSVSHSWWTWVVGIFGNTKEIDSLHLWLAVSLPLWLGLADMISFGTLMLSNEYKVLIYCVIWRFVEKEIFEPARTEEGEVGKMWEKCQNDKFKHNSENGNEFCPEPEMSFHGYELNINENVNRSTATARTTPNFKWIFSNKLQI